jgi:hypothetical protein
VYCSNKHQQRSSTATPGQQAGCHGRLDQASQGLVSGPYLSLDLLGGSTGPVVVQLPCCFSYEKLAPISELGGSCKQLVEQRVNAAVQLQPSM